jgi:8-oxo-dGTP pyrophosphatase MutT (NUDIX family)
VSVTCQEDDQPCERRLVPGAAPSWLVGLIRAAATADPATLSPANPAPPPGARRRAAVLVLFGHTDERGPDLLLQERAGGLRNHAGQVSFPGGGAEDGDGGPVATALREAAEETGLDAAGVDPVAPVDRAETAAVVRVPVADLAEPGNRFLVRHPSGWVGPAFDVAGMVVWGFTGGLVDALLRMGGWERSWSGGPVRDLDQAWAMARRRYRS